MHLLVIEDHRDSAVAMARILQRQGYEVTVAGSAADAHAECTSRQFDLLLVDLSLPDGDGWSLLPRLRALCNAPAIAVSGHAYEADRARSHAAGFDLHLSKPFALDELLAAIATVASEVPPEGNGQSVGP